MKKILIGLFLVLLIGSSIFAKTYLSGFATANKDEDSSAVQYYGFKSGPADKDWYIIKVSTYTVEYVEGTGATSYDIAWSSRTSITYYDRFDMY